MLDGLQLKYARAKTPRLACHSISVHSTGSGCILNEVKGLDLGVSCLNAAGYVFGFGLQNEGKSLLRIRREFGRTY